MIILISLNKDIKYYYYTLYEFKFCKKNLYLPQKTIKLFRAYTYLLILKKFSSLYSGILKQTKLC